MTHARGPGFAILIGFLFPLALGALLSDWRYSSTFEIQWINFADWLVAGSLAAGAVALLWSLLTTTLRRRWRDRPTAIAVLLLAGFVVLQFVNALTHAKDAYATMPAALILSLVTTLLAFAAAWTALRLPAPVKGDVQ